MWPAETLRGFDSRDLHRVARAVDAVNRIDCSKADSTRLRSRPSEHWPRANPLVPWRPSIPGGALRRDRSASRKRGGKLVPRVELELAEDARQVTLDRPSGDEEGLGDLAVGEALAGELGDPALAGRQ
jgi:hypothetical protein